jgi:hypothetical protein
VYGLGSGWGSLVIVAGRRVPTIWDERYRDFSTPVLDRQDPTSTLVECNPVSGQLFELRFKGGRCCNLLPDDRGDAEISTVARRHAEMRHARHSSYILVSWEKGNQGPKWTGPSRCSCSLLLASHYLNKMVSSEIITS